jgi:drug/metabolite transporter (DMT)-like permease
MSQKNSTPTHVIATQDWLRLLVLSILWGGSFLFIGIAVKEVPPLLVVLARVGIAAIVLIPAHLALQGPLPRDRRTWIAAGGMSILNNVLPFSLIMYGQQYIAAGLASVINATTPLFGALIMAVAGSEALTGRRSIALILGLLGVAVLKGMSFGDLNQETIGILCVLLASFNYGLSTLWAKRKLAGIPPLTAATCQLICSALIMLVVAPWFSNPAILFHASPSTWAAILALAILSTAVAYLIFFRIIASAGPSFVVLVTMLVPVSAIALGAAILGERLSSQEIIGALMIGSALLVIDGRIFRVFRAKEPG